MRTLTHARMSAQDEIKALCFGFGDERLRVRLSGDVRLERTLQKA